MLRLRRLDPEILGPAWADPSPEVRRRAAELGAAIGEAALAPLILALADGDDRVVEAACFGLGELGAAAAGAVGHLATVAGSHDDPLCREAAVAALGAVGSPDGLPAILASTSDKPAVRRRAVLALAPFEGPDVEAALARALDDRDWQVRQAAEDLLGPT
jgi:HEAT repeat protein